MKLEAIGLLGAAALAACGSDDGEGGRVVTDRSRIAVEENEPGRDDAVHAADGALPGTRRARLFADGALQQPIADVEVSAAGGFAPVPIGDNLHASVWMRVEDGPAAGWTIELKNDVRGPAVRIESAPTAPVEGREAAVVFTCDEEPCITECGVDGAVFAACASPFLATELSHGGHGVRVRGIDAVGNAGEAAYVSFAVTLAPADVRIEEGPSDPSPDAAARFTFASDTAGATFECDEGFGMWRPCASPHEFMAHEGACRFGVRAVLHERRSEPALWEWHVARGYTTVRKTAGPLMLSSDPNPIFEFVCDEACVTSCSLDSGPSVPCTSPHQLFDLAVGEHTFDVWTDVQGTEELGFRFQWSVDRTAPVVVFESGPAAAIRAGAATFAFACDDSSACTFECSLNEAAFTPCESPVEVGPLAEAAHLFAARAKDFAGNAGEVSAWAFVVDETAPVVTFAETPPATSPSTAARFVFGCDETCDFTCQLDEIDPAPCTSPLELSDLPAAAHTLVVRGRDAVGLLGEVRYDWTVAPAR